MSYEPENPTSDIGDDAQAWLAREHFEIQNTFNQLGIGRAGLDIDAPITSTVVLTQTPQKVTGYDKQLLPELKATSDLANSTIQFHVTGLWTVAFSVVANITPHNGNYIRGAVAQLHNETDNLAYKILDFSSVARYQDLIKFSISYPVYVNSDNVGKDMSMRAYTTNTNNITFTGVQLLEFVVILQVEY